MLTVFSEQKTALGGFDYSIINRLLGSPEYIDELSLFIRETAQNSWDARLQQGKENNVNYKFILRTFSRPQSNVISQKIFTKSNNISELLISLQQVTDENQPYIIIEDSGTVGLAGPTEADVISASRNFVSFVRNIGQDKHDQHSGGAFGFGKSVFFRFSSVRTIITYTRTKDENGVIVSRLMGMSLFKQNDNHTGRHWWGVPPRNGDTDYNQPLTGIEADNLAASIGFRTYNRNETGTAIMMLGPQFRSSSKLGGLQTAEGRKEFTNTFKEGLQIWYWPRMMGSGKQDGKLVCTLVCDLGPEETINPESLPAPLRLYKICLRQIQEVIANPNHVVSEQVKVIEIKRGRDFYGYLAIFKSPKLPRNRYETKNVTPHHPFGLALWGSADGIAANCRHVALLRAPGQVVRYEPTADSILPANEYGAVFLLHPCGPNADRIELDIKNSEPPSHDNWSYQANETVPAILSRIRGQIQTQVAPNGNPNTDNSHDTGKIALRLASLWGKGDAAGGGGGSDGGESRGGGGGGATIKSIAELGIYNKSECIFVKIKNPIRLPAGTKEILVSTKARTVGGGTAELDIDSGEKAGKDEAAPGYAYGWFSGSPEDTIKELITENSVLPVERLTPEVREKGIYVIIKNAKTLGLNITIKTSSNV